MTLTKDNIVDIVHKLGIMFTYGFYGAEGEEYSPEVYNGGDYIRINVDAATMGFNALSIPFGAQIETEAKNFDWDKIETEKELDDSVGFKFTWIIRNTGIEYELEVYGNYILFSSKDTVTNRNIFDVNIA